MSLDSEIAAPVERETYSVKPEEIAAHLSSIEVADNSKEVRILALTAAKLAQLFARQDTNFDVMSFVARCDLGFNKNASLLIAANGLLAKSHISTEEAKQFVNLALSGANLTPLPETIEEEPLAAPVSTFNAGDLVMVIKEDSRYKDQGPFVVIDVNKKNFTSTLNINGARVAYKNVNLKKAQV